MQIILNNAHLADHFGKIENLLDMFFPNNVLDFDYFMPFSFKGRDSRTLLVTIGDSWSWGSDLSLYRDFVDFCPDDWVVKDRTIVNVNQNRLEHNYGNIVSKKLHADWLNLSCAAYGNFHMAKCATDLSTIIPNLNYDKIVIICVFTEVGRHFNTEDDTIVDHSLLFRQFGSVDNFLADLNKIAVNQITTNLEKYEHVQLFFGTNFVDQIGFDEIADTQRLAIPWYQILGTTRESPIFVVNELSWKNIIRSIEDGTIPKHLHTQFKQWLDIIFKNKTIVNREIAQSRYYNSLMEHPNKQGHAVWADYLIKRICNDKQS